MSGAVGHTCFFLRVTQLFLDVVTPPPHYVVETEVDTDRQTVTTTTKLPTQQVEHGRQQLLTASLGYHFHLNDTTVIAA